MPVPLWQPITTLWIPRCLLRMKASTFCPWRSSAVWVPSPVPLVGALLINIVTEAFRFLSEYRMVVYALIIIGMMWLRPQGIAGSSDSVLVSGGSKKGRARRRTAHPKPGTAGNGKGGLIYGAVKDSRALQIFWRSEGGKQCR